MPDYELSQEIIELSGQELKKIGEWDELHNKSSSVPSLVLIGGWAVDAYNPYLGSVDIDLVTHSHTSHSLMHHLSRYEGYTYDVLYPFGKTVLKLHHMGPLFSILFHWINNIRMKATRKSHSPLRSSPEIR